MSNIYKVLKGLVSQVNNSIKKTPQTLTEEEKTQVKSNLGISEGASSWNDLQDKPFYEESEYRPLVEECVVTVEQNMMSERVTMGSNYVIVPFIEENIPSDGNLVAVYVDDNLYEGTCVWTDMQGDRWLECTDGDNFLLYYNPMWTDLPQFHLYLMSEAGTEHKVKIDAKIVSITTIPERFAPKDWNQSDASQTSYIHNRPFYENKTALMTLEYPELTEGPYLQNSKMYYIKLDLPQDFLEKYNCLTIDGQWYDVEFTKFNILQDVDNVEDFLATDVHLVGFHTSDHNKPNAVYGAFIALNTAENDWDTPNYEFYCVLGSQSLGVTTVYGSYIQTLDSRFIQQDDSYLKLDTITFGRITSGQCNDLGLEYIDPKLKAFSAIPLPVLNQDGTVWKVQEPNSDEYKPFMLSYAYGDDDSGSPIGYKGPGVFIESDNNCGYRKFTFVDNALVMIEEPTTYHNGIFEYQSKRITKIINNTQLHPFSIPDSVPQLTPDDIKTLEELLN